ncbi:MAG: NAD(P)-dependent oxidoreductase [Bacillaceae bacterium]|nr:NAD(P)-dependent oxidoreductase [Bacillaceae bacterium]
MDENHKTIGFVGTGVMGKSMARNLMKAGYSLYVYTRTKSKAEELINVGAVWCDSPGKLARTADVVITIVGFPHDVEEVYFSDEGIIENAKPGTYLIDMTTSKPSLAQKIYDEARKKGLFALDAPVSGGDVGAKNGTLAIMVGGDEEAFQAMKPIFEVLGSNIVLQGPAGAGQHTKMANQITIASNMIGVCEALAYAEKSGLDPKTVLKSISTGAAGSWSLSNLAPRMIEGNFEPGFYIKHFIKDMGIALEEAERMGIDTPGLKLAKQLYDELAEQGEGDSGTQALYKWFGEE